MKKMKFKITHSNQVIPLYHILAHLGYWIPEWVMGGGIRMPALTDIVVMYAHECGTASWSDNFEDWDNCAKHEVMDVAEFMSEHQVIDVPKPKSNTYHCYFDWYGVPRSFIVRGKDLHRTIKDMASIIIMNPSEDTFLKDRYGMKTAVELPQATLVSFVEDIRQFKTMIDM